MAESADLREIAIGALLLARELAREVRRICADPIHDTQLVEIDRQLTALSARDRDLSPIERGWHGRC